MKRSVLIGLMAISFCSCEKVVNIDLNTANPAVVIEADLYEGEHPFRARVSLTSDYYGRYPQQRIEDASVLLVNGQGDTTQVPHAADGYYELPVYKTSVGESYTLVVVAESRTFTSTTVMPAPVPIDSLTWVYQDQGFGDPGYELYTWFQDPEQEANYYRCILTKNDTLLNEPGDLIVFNDKFNNGNTVKADVINELQPGDKIDVLLMTMDEKVYTYFETLRRTLNNAGSPAPGNPVSNITGGALGYFAAWGRSSASATIQE